MNALLDLAGLGKSEAVQELKRLIFQELLWTHSTLVVFPLGFSTIRTTSLSAATERCVLRTAKGNKARPERRFDRPWIRKPRLMQQLGRP